MGGSTLCFSAPSFGGDFGGALPPDFTPPFRFFPECFLPPPLAPAGESFFTGLFLPPLPPLPPPVTAGFFRADLAFSPATLPPLFRTLPAALPPFFLLLEASSFFNSFTAK